MMRPALLVLSLAGCASAARHIDDVFDPADDAALRRCRNEGRAERAAARDAGASRAVVIERAYGAYVACTDDAGLR